jgi:transcriptional regulator with XRE-family HTH domain
MDAGWVAKPALEQLLSRLRQLREKHGLTQEAFAELSGMSYKYYQAVEGGRKPDLRLSTLERLARAYGLEVHQLLSPTCPPTRISKKGLSLARRKDLGKATTKVRKQQ